MADARKRDEPTSFTADWNAPLIARFISVDGRQKVQYFTSHDDAAASITDEEVARARELCGAWSDLDFDETIADLEDI